MTTTQSALLDRTSGVLPSSDESGSAMLRARIQAEYGEMPGLVLTISQATRLWGMTPAQSEQLLSSLVATGFLMRDAHGAYRRHGCPRCS